MYPVLQTWSSLTSPIFPRPCSGLSKAQLSVTPTLLALFSADALQSLRRHPFAFHPADIAIKFFSTPFSTFCPPAKPQFRGHPSIVLKNCWITEVEIEENPVLFGARSTGMSSGVEQSLFSNVVSGEFDVQQTSASPHRKTEFYKDNASYEMFAWPPKAP